eukprot:GHVL01005241.1.p1 GENE.GHVL01005241.1~~GHVL01005241.1.p1  ORF type:complete len:420 (-),score=66.57 GHVL01005241.1:36-1295(-)
MLKIRNNVFRKNIFKISLRPMLSVPVLQADSVPVSEGNLPVSQETPNDAINEEITYLQSASAGKERPIYEEIEQSVNTLITVLNMASKQQCFELVRAVTKLRYINEALTLSLMARIHTLLQNETLKSETIEELLKFSALSTVRNLNFINFLISKMKSTNRVPSLILSSILLSISRMNLWKNEDIRKLAEKIEKRLIFKLKDLNLDQLSMFAYSLVLAKQDERDQEVLKTISDVLTMASPLIKNKPRSEWSKRENYINHRSLLTVRCCLRYCHKDFYLNLSDEVKSSLRYLHKIDLYRPTENRQIYIDRICRILHKLKIAHHPEAWRGPLKFPVLERDVKVFYNFISLNKYFRSSNETLPEVQLTERLAKNMGIKAITIPHWMWSKLQHPKPRLEAIRMFRYMSLQHRRPFADAEKTWYL